MLKPPSFAKPKCNNPAYSKFQQLGWRTAVYRYLVRLAPYHRGSCEARGGSFLVGFIFSFCNCWGE
jgi:hypothetical protein